MARDQQEFRLHCYVVGCLRLAANRHDNDAIWFHPASGEYRPPATAGRLKRMGVLAGVPDLVFILPDGQAAFLELKRPGGKLSPEQEAFKGRVEACGCRYAVADNGKLAVEILKSWGLLRDLQVAA